MNHPWRNQWALITGASAGIGSALAHELAEGKANLVLTARRQDRLEKLAAQLREKYGVEVRTFAADLEDSEGPRRIRSFTEENGLTVEVLVNNAGFGAYGEQYTSPVDRQLAMVQVNCLAVVHLTQLYLPAMVARRSGAILILASTAAFQPVAYINTYAATKAFDLLFAEGLAEEVERFGIKVCALCPGPTQSEFSQIAGTPRHAAVRVQTAEEVARIGLRALAEGKHSVLTSFANKMQVELQRLAPRRFVVKMAAKIFRPKELT
ncbi:MAG TPA: SDR family oxidoreductase [Bryobacteraceae bacterium]